VIANSARALVGVECNERWVSCRNDLSESGVEGACNRDHSVDSAGDGATASHETDHVERSEMGQWLDAVPRGSVRRDPMIRTAPWEMGPWPGAVPRGSVRRDPMIRTAPWEMGQWLGAVPRGSVRRDPMIRTAL